MYQLKLSAFFSEKGVSRSNYQGPLIETEVFLPDECQGKVTKPTFSVTDNSFQEKRPESKHKSESEDDSAQAMLPIKVQGVLTVLTRF